MDASAIPVNVVATSIDATSIKITWDAVDGAAKYRVYRSLTTNGGYSQIGETTELEYTATGLTAGTTYYFKVRPYAADGTAGQYSVSASAIPTAADVVDTVEAPANVAATSMHETSIKVTWNAVEYAAGYEIRRSLTFNGGYVLAATIEDGAATEWTDIHLETGTTYYYIMRAIAPSGKLSSYSVKASAAPEKVDFFIQTRTLSEIADAIRSVTGETGAMTPETMAEKIRGLHA